VTGRRARADPRFARYLDRAGTASIQLVEDLPEGCELVGPPHEVPGKQGHGITVIDGGCPLMFGSTADFGHKIMRFVYAGHVPKQV
jgi:hypothetical protein